MFQILARRSRFHDVVVMRHHYGGRVAHFEGHLPAFLTISIDSCQTNAEERSAFGDPHCLTGALQRFAEVRVKIRPLRLRYGASHSSRFSRRSIFRLRDVFAIEAETIR
jgi:hypothetical protein